MGLQYGVHRRAVREALPRSEKRKLDVMLRQEGIGFIERRRLIAAVSAFACGVAEGVRQVRENPIGMFGNK